MDSNNYESMTLVELKKIAKDANIKNLSKLKKSEVIEALKENDKIASKPISIQKDGVV